ncbi:MAG: hypothetical protein ACC645_22105, partial [Pirellulales bacterium]
VTLRAAADRVGLSVTGSLRRTLPRPLLATVLLALPLLVVRQWLNHLTVPSFAVLAAVAGMLYVVLVYAVVLQPDERGRLWKLFQRGRARFGGLGPRASGEPVDEEEVGK